MSSNVFSINHAGAAGPLDGNFRPPEQLHDSAITDINAFSKFILSARQWDVHHWPSSSISIYTGIDRPGNPFLLVLDVDADKAAIFRGCYNGFEFAAPAPAAWGKP